MSRQFGSIFMATPGQGTIVRTSGGGRLFVSKRPLVLTIGADNVTRAARASRPPRRTGGRRRVPHGRPASVRKHGKNRPTSQAKQGRRAARCEQVRGCRLNRAAGA